MDLRMIGKPDAIDEPLQRDQDGVIYVGNTSVTLLTLLDYHLRGDSTEEIHKRFPGVPLADIYAIIAYYLANRDEVDEYIWQIETEAERLREEFETNRPQAKRLTIIGHTRH